ncbi:GntR family transcriptional regulator [Microvirga pudoricolor]|uniref:GntR family transcriptional regulator n=1 Tax=Microvirga pudoricolor TaxID=2778729 RepID=UPI00194F4D17|nr:GntR family transcriptional regulator [Microvirga pudoricolor]MBM6592493.1 GntR family transcriptional regulator [Microvirga pudoricolor]
MKPSSAEREPLNLRERAYDSFTRHLLARDIRAGQFISQRELVEITGLPLGAIRELIPRLEAEGLVRTIPQRGMQIAHVDLNLIQDAFQFRLFLEKEATAVFATEATDSVLAQLLDQHESIIATCERAEANGGITTELVDEAQEIDWSFHRLIIDALGNAIIADAYRVNLLKIRLIKQEQTRLNYAVLIPTMREHLAVIGAISTRDPAKASEAMGRHIMSARDRAIGRR